METQQPSWGYFDPDYETLSARINPPRVVVDNATCDNATLIKVDSANTDGVLLEVVQVLTDLNLCISKAYISSDGGWFMDVFHVTDQENKKVTDEPIIENIKRSLGAEYGGKWCSNVLSRKGKSSARSITGKSFGVKSVAKHTAIELKGADRPGLLSEISAVLTKLGCNVSHAEVWTHNMRVACVVYVTEGSTGGPVNDEGKQQRIKEQLCSLMGGDDERGAVISVENTNVERRLHQMMSSDWEDGDEEESGNRSSEGRPVITITTCKDKGYSIVNVESSDRPKLLFDTVFTLTDMKHVVFHGTINSENGYAHQEYYIRDEHGGLLESEADKQRVIKGLEAAIERRVSDGVRLELLASDKIGLLSEFTRMLRENGLSVTRADVETRGNEAVNVFYVTDAKGNPVDPNTLDFIQKTMNTQSTKLKVEKIPRLSHSPPNESAKGSKGFSFGSLIKSQSEKFMVGLGSLGWARSV